MSLFIVPLKGDATVEFAIPVNLEFVVVLEHRNEVIGVVLSCVLYSKVVDCESKLCWTGCALPEVQHVGYFIVPMWP